MAAFNQFDEVGEEHPAGELPPVARRALELRRLVVKDDNIVWVGDARGDIYPEWLPNGSSPRPDDTLAAVRLGRSDGAGLYHQGRRILSCCVLAIQSETLPPPAAAETSTYEACLAFPELRGRRDDLSAFRAFVADSAALTQWITLESQSIIPAPVRVTLTLACDGMLSDEAPAASPDERSWLEGATLRLAVRAGDGTLRRTTLTFDRDPLDVRWLGASEIAGVPARVAVSFHLYPALAEPAVLACRIAPETEHVEQGAPRVEGFAAQPAALDQRAASAAARDRHARALLNGALYTAHQPALDATLHRAAADLRLLTARTPHGEALPLAGLPDRPEVVPHDMLLAGFQSLGLDPAYATDALRALARHPALLEPGAPTMCEMNEANEGRRQAAVTPLWVALLGETLDWTGDRALFEELLPTARQAVRAMERGADRHGYLPAGDGRIWLEPQVYARMARRSLARALRRRGSPHDHAEIAALELGAENLRQHIERDFWLGAEDCYARALDGMWRPVPGATSAAAHALWARMTSGPRAARLAARLTLPDLHSGWGLRTLSLAAPAYDALAPEGGAVRTHETAFAAIGLLRSGHTAAGFRLARGLFAVAEAQLDARLPAYVGGQEQSGHYAAVPHWCAGASMPSAAAAAGPIALVAAMLGCEPDALGERLTLRPVLPAWLRRLSVQHLRVGAARVDVELTRVNAEGACEVSARVTSGECAVHVQPPTRAYA